MWITSLKCLNRLNYNFFSFSLASARSGAMSLAHAQATNFCRSLPLAKFVARYRSLSLPLALAPAYGSTHISPTLKALHSLKVTERIEYKVASLTYNALQFHQPSYLSDLLTVQSNSYSTRSSSLVTLKRPTVVKAAISKRSFYHSSPVLWNPLPPCLRQPAENSSNILGVLRPYFLAHLKTFLFSKSFPP